MASIVQPAHQTPTAKPGHQEWAFSSSLIQKAEFDLPQGSLYGSLTITFKRGDVHTHFFVPPFVIDMFLQSRSKGSFYNQAIKGKYASHRVVDKRTSSRHLEHVAPKTHQLTV